MREVAKTLSKVDSAKEEVVADFKRSTKYKKEILEVGQGELTNLFLA